jgi:rhodanese-related sulfurtransferase
MITVQSYRQWLDIDNIEVIFKEYDLILDCTDNFTTHYLINDTARFLGKPYIHGSIYQFEGVCTTIAADVMQPCYRCLYPKEPDGAMIPNCQSTGVLGVLPGLVGMIQATEAIKLIVGIGENLIGTLLYYDALSLSISKRAYIKNQHCLSCNGSLDLYHHYKKIKKITVDELACRLNHNNDIILLDVRDVSERKIFHIGGYHVLFSVLENKFLQLDIDRKKTIVVYCQSGQRSLKAAQQLGGLGYDHVMSLDGGIVAWQKKHQLFMYANDGKSEC